MNIEQSSSSSARTMHGNKICLPEKEEIVAVELEEFIRSEEFQNKCETMSATEIITLIGQTYLKLCQKHGSQNMKQSVSAKFVYQLFQRFPNIGKAYEERPQRHENPKKHMEGIVENIQKNSGIEIESVYKQKTEKKTRNLNIASKKKTKSMNVTTLWNHIQDTRFVQELFRDYTLENMTDLMDILKPLFIKHGDNEIIKKFDTLYYFAEMRKSNIHDVISAIEDNSEIMKLLGERSESLNTSWNVCQDYQTKNDFKKLFQAGLRVKNEIKDSEEMSFEPIAEVKEILKSSEESSFLSDFDSATQNYDV
jgi:hypothetical protein